MCIRAGETHSEGTLLDGDFREARLISCASVLAIVGEATRDVVTHGRDLCGLGGGGGRCVDEEPLDEGGEGKK